MSVDHPHPSPEEARTQLSALQTDSIATPRDSLVHAVATAVFGVSMAIYMMSQNVVTGTVGTLVMTAIFAGVWLGTVAWVERSARTVPRRSRFWSRLGMAASFVLALGVALPWLNYQAQTEPNTWPMVLAASLIVALPSLVAAVVIARGRS